MGVPITRRGVLLSGALLGAAVLVGRIVTLDPAGEGWVVLSSREAAIIESIAAVLFPPGIFPVHGGDGGTAPALDLLLRDFLDQTSADGFRYLLRAMEVGTLVARGVSFSELSSDEAREVIDIWFSEEPAPRRMVSDSFKVLLGMAFLNRPEVIEAIGWRRGCIDGIQI
jgi:hypothetical protein